MDMLFALLALCESTLMSGIHDNKVHGANMGHIWGRQNPGGPHVGLMNLAIRVAVTVILDIK